MAPQRLTINQRKLIDFIEQYWTKKGKFPSNEILFKFAEVIDKKPEDILDLVKSVKFNLHARGIFSDENKLLSSEQLAAIHCVVNYADKRSFTTKLNSLGITPTKWKGWMRDPAFKEHYELTTNTMFSDHMDIINVGLLRSAEAGNVSAVKFIYELTGKYNRQSPVANVQLLIVQIIEIIQKYVSDPKILSSIGTDFEMLLLKAQVQQGPISPEIIEGEIEQPKELKRVEKDNPSKLSPALANRRNDPDDLFG